MKVVRQLKSCPTFHVSELCTLWRLKLLDRTNVHCHVLTVPAKHFSSTPKKDNQIKIFTIPNLITASRIALTPFIVKSIFCCDLSMALGLTVAAGVTDALDGLIARKVSNQASNVGSFLDPLADKLLVTSLVLSLTVMDFFPVSLACLFIFRDLGIVITVLFLVFRNFGTLTPKIFTEKVGMNASNISKLNTLCQLSSIILSMTYPLYGLPNYEYLKVVWLLSAGTTIGSGLGYLKSLPEWRKRMAEISKNR
ncbi:unnamed protein product [Schistosoma rodhaini]|uniref:cardiolipin synthase (CMP-forming) n=1 Tax=Schistosoma rodhaini TaxID=6188 RepID=A0AA85GJ02_9TREM|nr:unnamed protein product [Schistosoma rodhaini]